MLRPDEFRDGMRQLADAAEPRSVPVDRIVARARRRYRTRQAVLPGVAAVCVLAVAAGVGVVAGAAGSRDPQPAETPGDSTADPRVPQDGDTVRAFGSVLLRESGPARLCAEQAIVPQQPASEMCAGVDVVGPPLAVGPDGRAGVMGTWRSGTIEAREQFDPPPAFAFAPPPEIPCPTPPGGWPTSVLKYHNNPPALEEWKRYLEGHPELNQRLLQLRAPGADTVLVFLAADETERVRVAEEIGALVGRDHVCAIVSNVDPDRGRRLLDELSGLGADGNPLPDATGPRIGQEVVQAGLDYTPGLTDLILTVRSVTVTPELAAFEAEHPGEVVLRPMVQVVGRAGRLPTSAPDPAASTTAPTPQAAAAVREYSVSMRDQDVYTDERWEVIRDCFTLPGAAPEGFQGDSLPPVQGVVVNGSAETDAFERCILDVEGARLRYTVDGASRTLFASGLRKPLEVSGFLLRGASELGLSLESCNARPQLAEVIETSDEVRVRVVGDAQDPANGDLCQDLFTFPLITPLDGRTVVDEARGEQVRPD